MSSFVVRLYPQKMKPLYRAKWLFSMFNAIEMEQWKIHFKSIRQPVCYLLYFDTNYCLCSICSLSFLQGKTLFSIPLHHPRHISCVRNDNRFLYLSFHIIEFVLTSNLLTSVHSISLKKIVCACMMIINR